MSKRQELRARRQRQARQRRAIALGGIVLVAVAVAGWLIYQNFRPVGSIVTVTGTPPPNSDGSAVGSPDAKVTVAVYSDFQCPACNALHEGAEKQIFQEYVYTGKIRYDYKHYIVIDPMVGGTESRRAAEASECAAEQGWFWPYHNILFANQTRAGSGDFADNRLKAFAGALGLNQGRFDSCLNSGRYASIVSADMLDGRAAAVTSTPAIFVPGSGLIVGAQPFDVFKQAIDRALAAAGQ